MKLRIVRSAVIFAVVLLAGWGIAWAGPQLVVTIQTSRELVEVVNGVTKKKMLPTKTAASGDVLQYTLSYTNKGNEAATNAVIDNPIPKGATYLANSAFGSNAEIVFSNDGGKTYAQAVKLTYEIKLPNGTTEKRVSTPSDYTNIRWTLKRVAPGEIGTVGFSVHVK
jgi:uncharacterized repeat protein (TIGR01451 family)